MIYWIISVLIGSEIAGLAYLNYWRDTFYTAIQTKNYEVFLIQLGVFLLVALLLVIIYANRTYLVNKWAVNKRVELTLKCQNKWIQKIDEVKVDNPSQRINQDINDICLSGSNLGIQFIMALLTAIVFTVIICQTCLSHVINPNLILLASYGYELLGTTIVFLIGSSLVHLKFNLQAADADHRQGLATVHLTGNDGLHDTRLDYVKQAFFKVIKKEKFISFFTSTIGQIEVVFPFLILAPFYFSGMITFGYLFQLSAAMSILQGSLAFIIQSYPQLIAIQTTYNRLKFLKPLLED